MSFKALKPCRLTILREACLAWSRLSEWNKATIGYEVFDALREEFNGAELEAMDVQLPKPSCDAARALRNAGQKLFRWLGAEECAPSRDKVFMIEHVIVSVMPDVIKNDYMQRLYGKTMYLSAGRDAENNAADDVSSLLLPLTKESSEAVQAMIRMAQTGANKPINVENCLREVRESVAMHNAAITVLEAMRVSHD